MKDLYSQTGRPWKARYAFKLARVATAPLFIIVTKTSGFDLNQAHYPIEKHQAWVRERQKPESSLFAQRAFQKPSGRPDPLLIY